MTQRSGTYEQMDQRKTVHVQGHEDLGGAGEKETTFHAEFTMGTSVMMPSLVQENEISCVGMCNQNFA